MTAELIRRFGGQLRPHEEPDERAARLRAEERRDAQRRRLEWAMLAVVAAVGLVAIGGLFGGEKPSEWGRATLTSIMTAALGYVAGKGGRAE